MQEESKEREGIWSKRRNKEIKERKREGIENKRYKERKGVGMKERIQRTIKEWSKDKKEKVKRIKKRKGKIKWDKRRN